jgi:hypothetical protein
MERNLKVDFCIEKINAINLIQRKQIFEFIMSKLENDKIDSSNSDGSRIYMDDINDELLDEIFNHIKKYLE